MTRVFQASSFAGAITLAAALDAGLFGDRSERRLLVVSNNAAVPELAPGFEQGRSFAALRSRFDDIVSWNDVVAPLHPAHWQPSDAELPMLSRLVTDTLGLRDGVTELVLESVGDAPAAAIGALLGDCPVTVYAGGAADYGPTRIAPPISVATRIERLVYPELVPSLHPLLLSEYDVTTVPLPLSDCARIVADLPVPETDAPGTPVIVGQALADLGLLDGAEERELYVQMLRAIVARDETCVVFRPHPGAAFRHETALRREADSLGVRLVVTDDGLACESWFAAARPSLVVSCSSSALFTAAAYDVPVATVGTDRVLERIAPYEHSERMAVTLAAATLPELAADGTIAPPPATDVPELVAAVGYCMQANRLPELRDRTVTYLAEHGSARYFKKKRMEVLNLVPAPTATPPAGRKSRFRRR